MFLLFNLVNNIVLNINLFTNIKIKVFKLNIKKYVF